MHGNSTSAAEPARARSTLKDQNRPALIGLLFINLAVLVVLVQTGQLTAPDVDALVKHWQTLLPAGIGVALAGVVNGLLSADNKARLVYWRWSNPLPGSRRVFALRPERDARIDMDALSRVVGHWPAEPRQQNAAWYRLYKSVEHEPAVWTFIATSCLPATIPRSRS